CECVVCLSVERVSAECDGFSRRRVTLRHLSLGLGPGEMAEEEQEIHSSGALALRWSPRGHMILHHHLTHLLTLLPPPPPQQPPQQPPQPTATTATTARRRLELSLALVRATARLSPRHRVHVRLRRLLLIRHCSLSLADCPLEQRLRDNHALLGDELRESERRRRLLERRVAALRRQHGELLPARKIEELYAELARRDTRIYVQRSRRLYCGGGGGGGGGGGVRIRDFPRSMLEVRDWSLWGLLVGTEELGPPRARNAAHTWSWARRGGAAAVDRNLPPLKFHFDISSCVSLWSAVWGPCWEPAWAAVLQSVELLTSRPVDPSAPLAWWDKGRLLLHGRLGVQLQHAHLEQLASQDPYNTTEHMHWEWSPLWFEWSPGRLLYHGDLDINVRTAS
ncbi:unnamed protein product, partial [Lampetra fluviatilis]